MSYPPRQADYRSSADEYNSVPLSEFPGSPSPVLGHYNDESPRPEHMTRSGSMANTLMSEPDPFASQTGLHTRANPYAGAGTPDSALQPGYEGEKRGGGGGRYGGAGAGWWGRKSSAARRWIVIGLVLLVVAIGVGVGAGVGVSEHSSSSSNKVATGKAATSATPTTSVSKVAAPSGVPTGASGSSDWRDAATGGDGSTVYLADGTSFTYNNSFGGFWNAIPFNNSAQAQLDSPPLSQEWDYQNDLIQGVNIGGWLVVEPFIVPAMFEPFNDDIDSPNGSYKAIDEWTLSEQLGTNLSAAMREHYDTFITEEDFAQIAGAGLNWVRIPIGWWAIETWAGEPFLAGVSWEYFLKAIGWARKYGLRINLDFHAVPGSQNGYNHSGKQGSINMLNGVMGLANAQRTLDYIRTLTEFISQDQYKDVVPMFTILNEPYAATIGVDTLRHFYSQVYAEIRNITGTGTGNGPFITFHDGFVTMGSNVSSGGWLGFDPGMDRVALDSHNYLCFTEPNAWSITYQSALPCNYWAGNINKTNDQFGVAMGGEWSLAINDCGKWLNNVGNGQRYDGTYYIPNTNATTPEYPSVGNCSQWNDYASWSDDTKAGFQLVAQGHISALRNFFFWTWKTGYSTTLGMIANPMWNYQLGLQEGYIPANPRTAVDACPSLVTAYGAGIAYSPSSASSLSAWMTGGTGAGTILDTAMYSSYSAWPPVSIGAGATPVSNLPTYTPTGARITLSASTPTSYPSGYSSATNAGDGWYQSSDKSRFNTPIATCSYPGAWSGAAEAIPTTAFCAASVESQPASNILKRAEAVPTAPPKRAKRARAF